MRLNGREQPTYKLLPDQCAEEEETALPSPFPDSTKGPQTVNTETVPKNRNSEEYLDEGSAGREQEEATEKARESSKVTFDLGKIETVKSPKIRRERFVWLKPRFWVSKIGKAWKPKPLAETEEKSLLMESTIPWVDLSTVGVDVRQQDSEYTFQATTTKISDSKGGDDNIFYAVDRSGILSPSEIPSLTTGITDETNETTPDGFVAQAPVNQLHRVPYTPKGRPHGGRNDLYTPEWLTKKIRDLEGSIDLDPASSPLANTRVKANVFYDGANVDGYALPWNARVVFHNGPFDRRVTTRATLKTLAEAETLFEGKKKTIYTLVPNTQAKWHSLLLQRADLALLPKEPIRFWAHDNESVTLKWPVVLLYFGPNAGRVAEHFSDRFIPYAPCLRVITELPSLPRFPGLPEKPTADEEWDVLTERKSSEPGDNFRTYSAAKAYGRAAQLPEAMVIDSGASYSIISRNLFSQLQKYRNHIRLHPWRFGFVTGIGGQRLFPEGYCAVPIELGPKRVTHFFAVSSNTPVPIILGNDFLVRTRAKIDFGQRVLQFHRSPESVSLSLFRTASRKADQPSKDESQRTKEDIMRTSGTVLLADTNVTIPAYTEMIVTACFPTADWNLEEEVFVTSSPRAESERGLYVGNGFSPITSNGVNILLANLNPEDAQIRAGEPVGFAMRAEECDYTLLSTREDAGNQTSGGGGEVAEEKQPETTEEIIDKIGHLLSKMEVNIEALREPTRFKLLKLLYDHRKTFSDVPGLAKGIEFPIDTGDNPAPNLPPRPLPYRGREIVSKQVKEWLEQGVISPSTSSYAAPLVLVPKKDGTTRVCVDYRALNSITITDKYKIPNAKEYFAAMQGCVVFSVLDMTSGYMQLPIKEKDRHKSAFLCPDGLFEFNRGSFGMKNMPGAFQRMMDMTLAGLKWRTCLAYLDDVIIFSRSIEEHLDDLREVLDRMRDMGLTIKPGKCALLQERVVYLGHVISKEGLEPEPGKIDQVRRYLGKPPKNVSEVRTFLGFVGYYRNFVPRFAHTAEPLVNLTRKGTTWNWTEKCMDAWNKLVSDLSNSKVLRPPNFDYPFILQTDASGFGLGAVLSQRLPSDPNNPKSSLTEVIIGCASRTLNEHERKWPNHEREALGVIWGCEYFRPYLWGSKFEIVVLTDNNAVTWLRNNIRPGRLTHWALRLSEFDFTLKHIEGFKNGNADYGSRLPNDDDPTEDAKRAKEKASTEDPHIVPGVRGGDLFMAEPQHGVILMSTPKTPRIIEVDFNEEIEEWKKDQEDDPKLGPIIRLLKSRLVHPEAPEKEVRKELKLGRRALRKMRNFSLTSTGLLVYTARLLKGQRNPTQHAVVVPENRQSHILERFHRGAGDSVHPGVGRMWAKIRTQYYWNGLFQDVQEFVSHCHTCLSRKPSAPKKQGLLQPYLHVASRPMDVVSMDLYGPLPKSGPNHGKYVLVVICHFSKWPECYVLPDKTPESVRKALTNEFLPRFLMPRKIVSDQGKEFVDEVSQQLWKRLGVKRAKTTAYHPQSNTAAERFNRFMGDSLYAVVNHSQDDWATKLGNVLASYRTSVHPATGETPYFLLYGRDPVLPDHMVFGEKLGIEPEEIDTKGFIKDYLSDLRNAYKQVKERLEKRAEKLKEWHDRFHLKKSVDFAVGDKIYIYFSTAWDRDGSSKFASRWSGPWRILEKLSDLNYVCQHTTTGHEMVVHVDRMRLINKGKPPIVKLPNGVSNLDQPVTGTSEKYDDLIVNQDEDEENLLDLEQEETWDKDDEFEVKSIKNRRWNSKRKRWEWEVEYEGYSETSWEPIESLEGADKLWHAYQYENPYPKNAKTTPSLSRKRRKL